MYHYSRQKPRSFCKAIERLEYKLKRYRGGKIPSSKEPGKEHPLHFAVRMVEAYRPRRGGSARQFGSLGSPMSLMWYSLLDQSRCGNREKAMRCRKRLLEMTKYITPLLHQGRDYTFNRCLDYLVVPEDEEIMTRGRVSFRETFARNTSDV